MVQGTFLAYNMTFNNSSIKTPDLAIFPTTQGDISPSAPLKSEAGRFLLARANHLRWCCGHTRFTPEKKGGHRGWSQYIEYKRQCPAVRLSRLPAKRTRVQPRQTWGRFYTSKPLTRCGTIAPDWGTGRTWAR